MNIRDDLNKLKNLCLNPLLLIVVVFGTASCLSDTFDGPEKLGGKWVSKETLNLGHDTYMQYCMQCHGVDGKGNGPAAIGSPIPPRNFTAGLYKFGNVLSGELVRDEDLYHTIKYGLRGTPMLPWDISPERLNALIQYIKTFSPAFKEGMPGEPLKLTPDPYGEARAPEAIALGKKVYHGLAQCYSCHPSYASYDEIDAASKEMTGNGISELREHPELSINQDSSYGHKFMPPDFTKSPVKTGGSVETLYQVIGAGIGGTSMPSWKGNLSTLEDEAAKEKQGEERLWALAYYVNSLHKLKFDWEARKRFFEELNAKRSSPPQTSRNHPIQARSLKPLRSSLASLSPPCFGCSLLGSRSASLWFKACGVRSRTSRRCWASSRISRSPLRLGNA